jgi:alcohol dehydrogenase
MPFSAEFDTLEPFDFDPRTRVVFGNGCVQKLGDLAREYGGRRALLVTDPGVKQAGHTHRCLESLESAGLHVAVFDDVVPNPTTDDVDRGLAIAQREQIDLLVAVGGGSAMDCAKGINFLYTNGGRMQDYWGAGKATRPMLPLIAVPTTAGTGSEAQSYALIADARTHMKMACGDKKAACRVALLDPELTVSMPAGVTAATGIDALRCSAGAPGGCWLTGLPMCSAIPPNWRPAAPRSSALTSPGRPSSTRCSAPPTRWPIRSPPTTELPTVWQSASCCPTSSATMVQ